MPGGTGKQTMDKFYRHIIGWFFIFLGVIGLFLPVLQGILFLFIGAIILAPVTPFFHRILEKFKTRHPDIFEKAHCIIERMRECVKRK